MFGLTLLGVCLAASSCQKQHDFGGLPIDAPGTFHCFNDQLVIKVVESTGDKLNYSVANKKISAGLADHALQKSASWFIFPQSIDRVWIFDGVKDVTLIEFYGEGGTKFTSSQIVPELLNQAPPEFLRELPAGFAQGAQSS